MTETAINIELYKSLFRGRTDVYAVRWEKEVRNGYMPVFKVDWTDYNKHKLKEEHSKITKTKNTYLLMIKRLKDISLLHLRVN